MATTKELINYLATLPEDTIVSIISGNDEVELDLSGHSDHYWFTDLTGNQFINSADPRFNKKYLILGEL